MDDTGIFYGIPYDEYEAWPGLRKSRLWSLVSRTPAHFRHEMDHPSAPTGPQRLGTATHTAILEPEKFEGAYAVGGPINPTTGRPYGTDTKKFAEWAEAQGRPVISEADRDRALGMRDAVRADPDAAMLLSAGRAEISMQWRDGETGLLLKGRLDWLTEGGHVPVDLKTAKDASPWAFSRDAYRYGYHMQTGMYWDGLRVLLGEEPGPFHFLVVESSKPYVPAVYEVEEEELEAGRVQYRRALETYVQCRDSGSWPGYGLRVFRLPGYAGQEEEDL